MTFPISSTVTDAPSDPLAWVRAQPDGTLYAEPHGLHFVTVTKALGRLRLWLLDQTHADSGVIQSEMLLDDPYKLVDPYTQAAMLGLLWAPIPQRVYVAGLGGGRVPVTLHHHFPQVQIECTEIDLAVTAVAQQYFGVPQDERLRVEVADGRTWLEQQVTRYDILFIDVFLDHGYVPYRLSTVEFFRLCRTCLASNGVLVVNILAEDRYSADRIETIYNVFDHVTLCPMGEDNTVVYATQGDFLDGATLLERAYALQNKHQFRFPFVQRALTLTQEVEEAVPNLEQTQLLYDDAPPPAYFDNLPSFVGLINDLDPALPCPCGSGKLYGECHGD